MRSVVIAVVINAGCRWPHPGHERSTGRVTRRSRTIGVFKTYSPGSESVQIWRDRLRVAVQMTDPVIEVVDCDEQDVGSCCRGTAADQQQESNSEHVSPVVMMRSPP